MLDRSEALEIGVESLRALTCSASCISADATAAQAAKALATRIVKDSATSTWSKVSRGGGVAIMPSDVLLEELEVLESIYPTELSKLSERDVEIDVEPEVGPEGAENLKLTLAVHFTDNYPDDLPELSLKEVDGRLNDDEIKSVLEDLRAVGKENLGMAMTFTLVSHLCDSLSSLALAKIETRKREEMERERIALEVEEARTRGTPVTVQSFKVWKAKFDLELTAKKARDGEEKLKALSPKEREESKKISTRLSGRQLFERDKNLEEDTLLEEGTVSVDISQYERTRTAENEDEDEHLTFSDSD